MNTRLSSPQVTVVEHLEGPLLVIAGPGSGKTRVLTERVRRLLTYVPGHFHVLALTFTKKAAIEMKDRLADLGDLRQRAYIGTIHHFCRDILSERGRLIGVANNPHIFDYTDRRDILGKAAIEDPFLSEALGNGYESRSNTLDGWLRRISNYKTHPISLYPPVDEFDTRLLEAYDAALRACDGYDVDDLLLLTYQLLSEYPTVADFYRRLYRYINIDEAQDLNEAQYAVLVALCGGEFRNVLMLGDPKQSIFGFASSSPDFLWKFRHDFEAQQIELTENFRSSKAVVHVAQALEPHYIINGYLPIDGEVSLITGIDEADEAGKIVTEIQRLLCVGHPDIDNEITLSSFAILGRTRYTLRVIEKELTNINLPYHQLRNIYEYQSPTVNDFLLALRVFVNPRDLVHLTALTKRWKSKSYLQTQTENNDVTQIFSMLAVTSEEERSNVIVDAIFAIMANPTRVDLTPGILSLRSYADLLCEEEKIAIFEDLVLLEQEWDQYLRGQSSAGTISGFLSNQSLGTVPNEPRSSVAVMTIHAAKGLEFDIVFIVGMVDGVFPHFLTKMSQKTMEEETRNLFVAVTRSKRLLYFSYPQSKTSPWGDQRKQKPSPYLKQLGLL